MNDDRLRRLLSDAVSDVEPDNRLEELRASVHPRSRVVPLLGSRRPWYAAAAVVATVVGVTAYITSVAGNDPNTAGPSGDGGTGDPTVTATDTTSPSPSGGTRAYAVYYVGEDPNNEPVLFREFHRGPDYPVNVESSERDLLSEAVGDAVTDAPLDPDYRSPWLNHGVTVDHASYDTSAGGGSTLEIALLGEDLAERPADVSAAEARAAVQQLVYTAQGALGKRVPVHFSIAQDTSGASPTLWGIDISREIAAGSVLETCSHISISNPGQGDVVSGKLRVTGVNNGFEGTAVVYLERNGRRYLTEATIGGSYEDKLFPWEVTLDLSKVQPGTYTLVAQNDDPSGGNDPETDTRAITVD
jgi:hypothetical protein